MYEVGVWVKRWLWALCGFAVVWAGATVTARTLDSRAGTKVL